MEGKRKWGRVLSVMLTIVMLVSNTSMTTFADIVGGVVQQKEESNEQDGQEGNDVQKPSGEEDSEDSKQPGDGEETEDSKEPEDGEKPEDGKESGDEEKSEDGKKPGDEEKSEDGKEPGDEKGPEDTDAVQIHVQQEVFCEEEETVCIKYTVDVTNTGKEADRDTVDTGTDVTDTDTVETGTDTDIVDTETVSDADTVEAGADTEDTDTAEIVTGTDTAETDIVTYKEPDMNTTAREISLKAVLGAKLSYYKGADETGNLNYIEDIRQVPEGLDLSELDAYTTEQLAPYTSAVLWENQSLAAGETAQFIFYANVSEDTKEISDLPVMYFINGEPVSSANIQWENAELLAPDETEAQTYTYEDDQVTITVEVPEGVELPEGAELKADLLEEGTQEFETAIDTIKEQKDGKNIIPLRAYDVYFLLNGEKIEPQGGFINISMVFKQPVDKTELDEFDAEIQVIHIDETNNNTVENVTDVIETNQNGEIEEVAFSTESLSPLVLLGEAKSKYPYSDKTLADYGGDYSLHYILNNYVIFTKDKADVNNHTVGPVAAGGTVYHSQNIGSQKYKHPAPSFFKGELMSGPMKDLVNLDLFIGKINQNKTIIGDNSYNDVNRYYNIYVNDNFIDFDAAFTSIQSEASALASSDKAIIIDETEVAKVVQGGWYPAYTYTNEYYSIAFSDRGAQVNLKPGYAYKFNNYKDVGIINVQKNNEVSSDTIIICNQSGTINEPKVFWGGSTDPGGQDVEIGAGCGIVKLHPYADKVIVNHGDGVVGHEIAPNADVEYHLGAYNGCVLAKSFYTTGEGHVWPYNGDIIKPTSHTFGATKTVNGTAPSSDQKFTFLLDELKDGVWTNIQTTENILDKVAFRDIGYSTDNDLGDHWYRISEQQETKEGYKLSTVQYLLKVTVGKTTSGNTTTYTKTDISYYKVKNSDTETITPDSLLNESEIDPNKLESLSGNAEFIFNNTTVVEDGSLKITKAAAPGTALDGKTFYFQVKSESGEIIKNESNGSDTWSITFSNKGENSITIGGLKPGQYTVTEVADEAGTAISDEFAYTVTTTPTNGTVTVEAGGQKEVTVTNEEKKVKENEIELEGVKTINGSGTPDVAQKFDFVWVDITNYDKLVNKSGIKKFEGNFNKSDLINYVQGLPQDAYTVIQNDGGIIRFPKLKYTENDQGKTYFYAIYEKEDKKFDLRPDVDIYVVEVNLAHLEKPTIKIFCGSPANGGSGNNCTYHAAAADQIIFDNTTEITPAKVQLNGEKTVLGGTSEDVFRFGMYSLDTDANKENLVHQAEVTGAGTISFPELQFTSEGTYTYIIREIADSTKPYNYDKSYYKVIINVTKKGNKLEATKTITKYPQIAGASTVTSLDFTNTIKETTAEFKVKKNYLADRDKKFDFILTAKNNAPMPEGSVNGTKTIQASQNSSAQGVSFGAIAYGTDGSYDYEIKEVNAGTTADGITYSDANYEVQVTVSTVNGNRTAAVAYRQKATPKSDWTQSKGADFTAEFTNTYHAEGSIILETHKELNGKDLEPGMFTFKLLEGKNELSAVTNNADGSIVFDPITYTETGKHTYTVQEQAGNEPGITYDKNPYEVTVEVTDNGQGGFDYKVQGAAPIQGSADNRYQLEGPGFVNTYHNAEAIITPTVTKTLTGRDMKQGEFTFLLYEQITNGEKFLTKGTNEANGEVHFEKPIKITLEDMKNGNGYDSSKEFTYVIREQIPDNAEKLPGVTYDKKAVTLTVVANYDNKTQEITLNWKDGKDSVAFENLYTTSESIGLNGTKVLNGRSMNTGEFQFEAEGPNNQIISGTNDEDGKINFQGKITITLDDMKKEGGGYESFKSFDCIVRETKGNVPGVHYDLAQKTLTLNAAYDEKTGKLTLSWAADSKSFTFINTYDTSTVLSLSGTKKLTGRAMIDNEFIFQVTAENGEIPVAIGHSKADGTIEFPEVVIKLSDMTDGNGGYLAEKIFTYTVKEVAGAEGGGIIYDTNPRTIRVKAAYNADSGSLTAELMENESNALVFKNSYVPSDSVSLVGTKHLEGRDLRDGEFGFVVLDKEHGNKEVSRGVNDKSGNIVFDPIKYELDDMSDGKGGHLDKKIFTYTVKEIPGNLSGVTYDNTEYEVQIEVNIIHDAEEGTEKLTAQLIGSNTPLTFTNSYKVAIGLEGTKSLFGRKLNDDEFTFTVTPEAGGDSVSTGTSKADGTIEFTDIEITLDQMKDPVTGEYLKHKQFKYIVTEDQNTALENIIYDTAKEITLNASYDKDQDLLTLEWAKGEVPVLFENKYVTDAKISLAGTKVLDGRDMTAGEFQFKVISDNGLGTEVSNGTNDKNGKITFTPDITITSEQMKDENGSYVTEKQFRYMVKEVKGNTPGITYDESTISLTLNASYDHSSGGLSLKWDTENNAENEELITFTNTYEAKNSLVIKGSKKVNGEEPSAAQKAALSGMAEFTLARAEVRSVREDGNQTEGGNQTNTGNQIEDDYKVIDTQMLDEDGQFVFEEQNFSRADAGKTYRYKITESKVEAQGFGIDSTEHIFTVKVTDNSDGSLDLDVRDDQNIRVTGDITVFFDNSYKAAGEAVLTGSKKLLGERHEGIREGEFKFVVLDKDGREVTTGATAQADPGEEAKINFAPISYTEKDAGAEYVYTVKEVSTDADGNAIEDTIDYDDTSFEVKVKVQDNQSGVLQTIVTYPEGFEAGLAFTNAYKAEGQAVLEAYKTLEGRNAKLQAGEFSFIVHEIIGGNRVPVLDADGNPLRAFNGENGSIRFAPIKYTQDAQGIPYYEITEEAGNDPSITYDTQPVKATVTVTDKNSDGTLDTEVSYETDGHTAFTNTYRADGSVTFIGTKNLLGNRGEAVKEGEFTFTVTDKETGKKAAEGVTKEGGHIEFTTIYYEAKDVGTHTYVITEDAGSDSSIQYSGQSMEVSVTVTDQGAEALETSVAYPKDGVVFENEYRAEGAVVLQGTKKLTGGRAEALKDGEFTFTVTEDGREAASGSSKADGTITFSEIKYTQADIGTHTYKISEVPGTDSSIEYSREVFTVTVEVTDLGQGKLKAVAAYPAGGVVFENKYHTGGRLVLDDVLKVLEGSPLAAGQFTFELRNSDGRVLQTKTNGADGRTAFDALEYTEADMGKEFTYTIAEVKKDVAGVTFDQSVYTVKVQIGDRMNSDGTLNITKELTRNGETVEQAVFTNRFAGSVTLQKNSTGGTGLAGASFMLYAKTAGTEQWAVYTGDFADGVYTTDRNGVITVNNLPANDYYFIETEAPAGYVIKKDADGKDIPYYFTIGVINGDAGIVENAEVYPKLTVVNETSGTGGIRVTKRTEAIDEDLNLVNMVVQDATFYVNLFKDAEGKQPYNDGTPTAIHLVDASSGTAVFDNLETGTYYVFETDAAGNAIPMNELQTDGEVEYLCTVEADETNQVGLDLEAADVSGTVNLVNRYLEIPRHASIEAWLNINKKVLRGTTPVTVNDTFYAGIFTKDEDDVYELVQVAELKQNETVKVQVTLGGEDGMQPITYYVFETDSEGNQIDPDVFEYTVSIEGGEANLDTTHTQAAVTITNQAPQQEITPTQAVPQTVRSGGGGSNTPNRQVVGVKTGDDTPINWFILLLALAAATVVVIFRRKKQA